MSPALRMALVVGPLAAYFATLGILHGGRRPVIVPGPLDTLLLAIGLSGLVLFGPIGEALVQWLFPSRNVWGWLTLASVNGLVLLVACPRASRRLVVYRVRPESLRDLTREALPAIPEAFAPKIAGFEDRERGREIVVEASARWCSGTIEAHGPGSEALIAALIPSLRELARARPAEPGLPVLALFWFGLSILTVLLPITTILLGRDW